MTQVLAYLDDGPEEERRGDSRRLRANALAVLRRQREPNEAIQIVDISPEGCGFRSRRPMQAGNRVWLGLPGLETWVATVAWFEDGKGGLRFDRPLHPAVAARLASSMDGPR
jgi:PilZ domain